MLSGRYPHNNGYKVNFDLDLVTLIKLALWWLTSRARWMTTVRRWKVGSGCRITQWGRGLQLVATTPPFLVKNWKYIRKTSNNLLKCFCFLNTASRQVCEWLFKVCSKRLVALGRSHLHVRVLQFNATQRHIRRPGFCSCCGRRNYRAHRSPPGWISSTIGKDNLIRHFSGQADFLGKQAVEQMVVAKSKSKPFFIHLSPVMYVLTT
jgi:hypothetical protein